MKEFHPPVMLHCAKLIVWRPKNSAKLRDRKDVPVGPAARTKVWSCFFVAGREGGGGGKRYASERGGKRERPAKRCWRLTEINEGERESERPNPPAEFERYSPTFLKTLECDFRANADPERGLADPERGLPEPTASANASWSFPWLKCGVNAGGTFHTQTSLIT